MPIPAQNRRMLAIERAAAISLVVPNSHGDDFDRAFLDACDAETELNPTSGDFVTFVDRDLGNALRVFGDHTRIELVRGLLRSGVLSRSEAIDLEPACLDVPL